MNLMEKLAEDRIRAAMEEGLFRNLPGQGMPLNLKDDSSVPEDLRLAFKILKNAGCLPIEMERRKGVHNLQQLIKAAIDEGTRKELQRQLNFLLIQDSISQRR